MEFLKFLQTMQQTTQIKFGFIKESERFSDVFGTKAAIRLSKRLRSNLAPGIYLLAPNSRIRGALLVSPEKRKLRLLAWQNIHFCTRQYLCDTSSAAWFGMFHKWPTIYNSVTEELPLPEIVLENHNSYLYEKQLLEAVKNGDLQSYNYYFCCLTGSGDFGKIAKGQLRNKKNLLICAITLLTRQAIEGGVSPSEAFALSDRFCQQVESREDIKSLNATIQAMGQTFIELIQKHKHSQTTKLSLLAQKIEMSLRQHCGEKITLDDLANELGRDKYYLSHLYKQETGHTITQYENAYRVSRFKSMLLWTDWPISEIADELGFATVSYASRLFKNIVGMPPQKYRELHQMPTLIDENSFKQDDFD